MSSDRQPVVIIGGPTASGKSALALDLAKLYNGVVVNADSMQLYAELSILTARPSAEDEAQAPHRLYGVLPAAERGTAARWRLMALEEIDRIHAAGRLPVLVGGTGLYLRALMQGLADIPPVPEAVRYASRADYTAMGGEAFRARLVAADPESAKLHAGDVTRLTRAWEVLAATGRPLSDWRR
ncbi:MAG TPA: tRNA (adenosine(37)-N6)-dimethylallyltransferase MiaA, partial [Azospirillaceae bacterium]|nr:tRNA (adenosine(37)-N6)-dimethylallyltransferase MiaA [Azospirillaceae bacterium]